MTQSFERDRSQMSSVLLGLVCGAAAGAVLGLLLAPRPGAELRHQMADSARRAKQRATEAYDQASGRVRDVVERSRRAYNAGRDAYYDSRAPQDVTRTSNISAS